MSIDIKERIDVTVSSGTQPISTATFDSALYLVDDSGVPVGFTDPYRVYTKAADLLDDGFTGTDAAYLYAALVFGGNFPPKSLYVATYEDGVTTPTEAFGTVRGVDDTAYFVGCDSEVEADVTALALACEAANKMYVTQTASSNAIDPSDSSDIGSVLQAQSLDHVLTLYSLASDGKEAAGGVVGAMAAIPAGISTLEDKTLKGVTSDTITATAQTALKAKNIAFYSPIAGVNSLFNSKVASGQFFDTIVFSDWLKARLGEAGYGLLKRKSDQGLKVSYDEAGMSLIRSALFQPIQQGLSIGSISPDIPPVVRTPTRDEVLDNQRADRVVPNVVVEVLYTNGVHKVLVRAYVNI